MSHYMTALAMQQKGLKPATKVVLYWLADHHNSETGLCFPSLSILAEECDLDRSTVIRHIVTLERCGLLMRVHRKRKNGSTTSNGYQLFLEKQPVGKYNPPSRKMPPPPVVNCDPHNLGSNNLGNEPIGSEDPKPKAKRSCSLPDGWVPSDRNIEDAMKRGFSTEETNHEAEQFRNYHHAKGSTFKDWDAAWRTWLGNAKKFARSRPTRANGGHNALMAGFASYAAGFED